jgi:3-hydroxymyristoyl/3-hydroxydecanoyl-(acyl carrier protein) dehydratase
LIHQWGLLKDVNDVTTGTSELRIDVPVDCAWFKGHFPGEPILPGIALVHLVYEAISAMARQRGESVEISSLKRIRFTGPVRPGDTLQLSLKHEGASEGKVYTFKAALNEQTVCGGQVSVVEKR